MRSPTKTDFDIVEDMDYEESHIEQELTIQGMVALKITLIIREVVLSVFLSVRL